MISYQFGPIPHPNNIFAQFSCFFLMKFGDLENFHTFSIGLIYQKKSFTFPIFSQLNICFQTFISISVPFYPVTAKNSLLLFDVWCLPFSYSFNFPDESKQFDIYGDLHIIQFILEFKIDFRLFSSRILLIYQNNKWVFTISFQVLYIPFLDVCQFEVFDLIFLFSLQFEFFCLAFIKSILSTFLIQFRSFSYYHILGQKCISVMFLDLHVQLFLVGFFPMALLQFHGFGFLHVGSLNQFYNIPPFNECTWIELTVFLSLHYLLFLFTEQILLYLSKATLSTSKNSWSCQLEQGKFHSLFYYLGLYSHSFFICQQNFHKSQYFYSIFKQTGSRNLLKRVGYQLYIIRRAIIIKSKQLRKMHKFFPNLPMKKPAETNNMDIENPQSENVPWVEKYRPSTLDDLSYQYEVTSALKNIVKSGNIPHLLFYGPAGTGKTSAIIAMAKEIFGLGFYKQRIIQLNASDERGINVIRQKVKTFAQKIHKKNPDASSNSPKTKIIILDEADLLTNDAQSALRRIIQDYSANTRFCIICNYITKIIEPLASRCIKFRFKPIPSEVQFNKLTEICEKENVNLNRKDLQLLVEKGDLRQSINSLQSLSKISTVSQYILPVSTQFCDEIFHRIIGCSNMKQVYELAEEIGCQGYAIDEIINGLFTTVLRLPQEKSKAVLMEALAKAGEGLELGASELSLVDLFTSFFYVLNLSI